MPEYVDLKKKKEQAGEELEPVRIFDMGQHEEEMERMRSLAAKDKSESEDEEEDEEDDD